MARSFFKALAERGRKTLSHGKCSTLLASALTRPGLWHLNRHTVAWAVSVGLFVAFVPVPFQMLLAGVAALTIGCNLPISVAMVWVSNPVTIAPLFYGAYLIGAWILGDPADAAAMVPEQRTVTGLIRDFGAAWKPFIVGCFVAGVVCAAIGHGAVRLAWRLHVGRAWQQRRALRRRRLRSSS